MCAFISVERCEADYDVIVNCPFNLTKGTVAPNPDVAGIGVSLYSGHLATLLLVNVSPDYSCIHRGDFLCSFPERY